MPLPVQICTWNLEFILRPRWKVSLNFALPFHVIYNTFFCWLEFYILLSFCAFARFFHSRAKEKLKTTAS